MRNKLKDGPRQASEAVGCGGATVGATEGDVAEFVSAGGPDVDVAPLDFGPVGEWLADAPGPFLPIGAGRSDLPDEPLVELDVSRLFPSGDARLDRALVVLDAVAAAESRVFAAKMHALYEAAMGAREADVERAHDLTTQFLPTHVAGTLTVHQGTARGQLEQAKHLVGRLPGTWRLLDVGRLRVPQALVLVEETAGRSPALCAAVERQVLPWSPGRTASEVRRRARRVLKRLEDQAEGVRARADAAAARAVSVLPLPDGMTGIWATMPAGAATMFAAALRQLAGRLTTENDERTAAQRESDVLAALPSLVLDGLTGKLGRHVQAAMAAAGFRPGGRAAELTSVLLVPAASALGLNDEPGELTGYGPVSAEHARALLRTAVLRLAEVDPTTGRILGLSESCHRPSAADLSGLAGLTAETKPGVEPPTARARAQRPAPPPTFAGTQMTGAARSEPATTTDAGPWSTSDGRVRLGEEPGQPSGGEGATLASEVHIKAPEGGAAPGWHRWLVGQLTGSAGGPPPEPPDEPQYRPSAALDRVVRLRDLRCIGIGCSCPSHRCDIEHREAWPAGPTGPGNLSPVSRRCHRMKQTGWSYTRSPDGVTTWAAPGGRTYRKPPDYWPIETLLPTPPARAPD